MLRPSRFNDVAFEARASLALAIDMVNVNTTDKVANSCSSDEDPGASFAPYLPQSKVV